MPTGFASRPHAVREGKAAAIHPIFFCRAEPFDSTGWFCHFSNTECRVRDSAPTCWGFPEMGESGFWDSRGPSQNSFLPNCHAASGSFILGLKLEPLEVADIGNADVRASQKSG